MVHRTPKTSSRLAPPHFFAASISIFLLLVNPSQCYVPCNTTDDCLEKLPTPGVSVCEDGECTNPFEEGCIKAMAETYGPKNLTRIKMDVFEKIRICNSDDYNRGEEYESDPVCRIPSWKEFFDMGEMRVINGQWTSIVILSWMYQILLTELLEVPTTMENGLNFTNGEGNFYYRKTDWVYSDVGEDADDLFKVILESHKVDGGDCRNSLEPCGQIEAE